MSIYKLDLTEIIGKLVRRMYVHPVRFEMVYEDIDLEDISDPDCETVDELNAVKLRKFG